MGRQAEQVWYLVAVLCAVFGRSPALRFEGYRVDVVGSVMDVEEYVARDRLGKQYL